MSIELDQYLNELPIKMIRLVDGAVVIARVVDEDSQTVLLQHPYEVNLVDGGDVVLDIGLNSYMYLSDASEITIQKDKIISTSSANLRAKNFYSKVVLRHKLKSIVSKEGFSFTSDIMDTLFDELDNQGSSSKTWNKPWPPREDI
jgi:hypothetical protein